jgi:predicted O-methyltransferase YrrM
MPDQSDEPTSQAAIADWIRAQTRAHDRYAGVYDASEWHRAEHGGDCDVYPSSSGPLLGALAAAARAKRILEVGCGLGYSALWLADGAGPDGTVETCEKEPLHAEIARRHLDEHDAGRRVTIHAGRALDVLAELRGEYGMIFADGDPDEYLADLEHFMRLLKPGGTLITSNLFLGVYLPDAPWLADAAEYRRRILDDPRLRTVFLPEGKALSVRTDPRRP